MNRLGLSGRPFIFVVDYKQEQVWVAEPEEVEPGEVLYDLNGVTNVTSKAEAFPEKHVEWETNPVSFETYSRSFRTVIEHIYAGNSYLVNLTCATPVRTNLTLKEIFYLSHAPYKLWVKERFVVFSPEIFVRIEDGFIYSYPMKGTIDASLPDARERILADKKEEAEHATIVDLIRNDLSQVASEVTVSRYRYIDELQTNRGRLLQVSSEIRGKLPEDWKASLGDILFRLLQRLRNLLCSSISVSLSAYALITPLCAFYFGTVSLVGVVTNLLTLWAVNLIFNGMVILCVLFPVLPAAAKALGWLLSWPVRYVLAVSGLLADFPLAAVYTKSIYVAFWLGFVYLLLLVFLLMKKKQPGVLLCCGTLGLCLALLASWVEPLLASTRWLDSVMRNKGINGRVEYWGLDVNHDWPWWYKMVDLYVPQLLEL